MPVDDDEAQRLLLASMTIAGDRWAFHEHRSKCYRFKITHTNVYHGYEVEREEVPPQVWTALEAAGIIPKKISNRGFDA